MSKRLPASSEHVRPPFPKANHVSADINKLKNRDSHRKRKLTSTAVISEGENNTLETSSAYYVTYYEPLADEVEIETRQELLNGANSQKEGMFLYFANKLETLDIWCSFIINTL